VQVIRENLAAVGIKVETQLLDQRDLVQRLRRTYEYEAMLFGFNPTDVAPDILADLWVSSGSNHFWYPNQPAPATPWEKETDSLVSSLVRTVQAAERKALFNKIQEIWARELPAIPIVSPSVLVGWRSNVGNLRPSILGPHLLWNAEELTLRSR
jgi:peptide/nickel transport system substrate-binding protein